MVKRYNQIKIVDIPVPEPKGNEVLVKIDACGVCGSDFIEAQVWAKNWKRFGHEIAATVAGTGEGVTGISVGNQVVVALSVPCGTCTSCITGHPRKCNRLIVVEQGGFAEYLLVKDYRLLYKVDPVLPAELVCLTEPLTVILDAFQLVNLQARDTLLVVGGGNIGCMSLLAAKALGINVLGVIGRSLDSRLTTCLGAAGGSFFPWRTLMSMIIGVPTMLKQRLSELSGRLVVLHTAPAGYISRYFDALPYDSTIVNIGLSTSRKKNAITLDASKMIFKRIQFMSAFPVPCMHLSQAISVIREHRALFSLLSIKQLSLEQLPDLIASSKGTRNKIIIKT